jgi:hypothetical protein
MNQLDRSKNIRVTAIIERNNGRIMKFADLPITCQDAMIHYMSVDGSAWAVSKNWPNWRWGEGTPYAPKLRRQMLADIDNLRYLFVEQWGNEKFGMVTVPTKELIDSIREDDFHSDDNYEEEPTLGFDDDWEYDHPTWPVILSDDPVETLQDGWTRFRRYCQLGTKHIPCLYYVD